MGLSSLRVERTQLASSDPDVTLPPSWTVWANGDLVTDALFALRHEDDPTQIAQCLHCGTPWCADGGCVTIRRVGSAVVWLRPISKEQSEPEWGARYAPLRNVDDQPVWFSLDDYSKAFDVSPADIRPLGRDETSYLLRAALMPWLGAGRHGEPLAWEELDASLLFREAEPNQHPRADRLLEVEQRIRSGAVLHSIREGAPSSACRLLEGFERGSDHPVTSRLLLRDSPGEEVWTLVGSDCWGQVSGLSADPG